jgi:hypothetical protein
MVMDRRKFIGVTSAAGVGLLVGGSYLGQRAVAEGTGGKYTYRLAFDIWMNDVRNDAPALANWPYGELDDKTVEGIVSALDVQAESGYNLVDLAGLWTTYGWPVDLDKVVDKDRQRRINQILKAAHDRKMKVVCFPSGVLNWGMDEILKAHPELATDNKHELNPFKDESWQWLYKIFDYAADNYDIDGYHLEAADQGRCKTSECMEKWPDNVAYYCDVTGKLADYLRKKYPNKVLITTVQGFSSWGKGFNEEQMAHVIDLSKRVDCLFDQGHRGTYVPQSDWKGFAQKLHCAFGTSGGIWVYPPQRWERTRWFLPYTGQCGKHIKELYEAGGRAVMYYQGPVANPGTEVNIAFGGRLMSNVERSLEDTLAETLEHIYHPKNTASLHKLVGIYQKAESVYFDQWNAQKILEEQKMPRPGELHVTNLFGASPGAAQYLVEPFLDTDGRMQYKQGLISLFKEISSIENDFNDGGRIARIKHGMSETMVDINNIAKCKNETAVWDDQAVGRKF